MSIGSRARSISVEGGREGKKTSPPIDGDSFQSALILALGIVYLCRYSYPSLIIVHGDPPINIRCVISSRSMYNRGSSPPRRPLLPAPLLLEYYCISARAFNARLSDFQSATERAIINKLPVYPFQNTASYSMKEQNEQRMTDIEDIDSPGMGIRVRTTAPVCYGRNMTFPRPTSSYAHRHELPAIVTEGESCRLLAEVRAKRLYMWICQARFGPRCLGWSPSSPRLCGMLRAFPPSEIFRLVI